MPCHRPSGVLITVAAIKDLVNALRLRHNGGEYAISAVKPKPVRIWAIVGAAILALQLYVWIRWVTGLYFERAPAGPSDPPTYMKVLLSANAILMWVWAPFAVWLFIVRPWLRERRITLDGMLVASMGLMFFQ